MMGERAVEKPWFDPKTNTLLLDEYVADMPSFRKILEDQDVTPEEVREQAQRVIGLLETLEKMLSTEAKAVATDLLCELAVLYAVSRKVI
jgi:flagellin-specific chaperone FliS